MESIKSMRGKLNRQASVPILPVFPRGACIPRIIHQVYATRELPAPIQESVRRIRDLNPRWEYRFYDDHDMTAYIRSAYGAPMLAYYDRVTWKYGAARADLFRYLLMYREGGVYLDIKSSLKRPLDEVLREGDTYVLSRWPNADGEPYEGWGLHRELRAIEGGEFQQWHIIAAPGHPFLRAVIERVMYNIDNYNPVVHDVGKAGVLRVTGPIAYTQAITPLLGRHQHRLVDSHEEIALTYSVYTSGAHDAHRALFRHHYKQLNEPVARLTAGRRLIWLVFSPVRNYVIVPVLNIADAVSRRITGRPIRRA